MDSIKAEGPQHFEMQPTNSDNEIAGSNFAMKLDPFGIPLSPTPTDDILDPLNWSKWQKRLILLIACSCTFLPLYMTTSTVAAFFALGDLLHVVYSDAVPAWTKRPK